MTSSPGDQQSAADLERADAPEAGGLTIRPDDEHLREAIDDVCRHHLASPLAAYEFFHRGAGSVHGLRLVDGRRVVVNVHAPWIGLEVLEGISALRRTLFQRGFPTPEQLAGPIQTPIGLVTVEETVVHSPLVDGHDPLVRRVAAATLAWLVDEVRHVGPEVNLPRMAPFRRLYPATVRGVHLEVDDAEDARWIDELAALARTKFSDDGSRVVGHGDWTVQNLAIDDARVTAVFGWDSLRFDVESVLVGHAAVAHTGDDRLLAYAPAPLPDEVRAFVDDYEDATGHRFRGVARECLFAAATYAACCAARLECTEVGGPIVEGSYRALLQSYGDELLRG